MRCHSCGSENPEAKRFCGDCAAPLSLRCPKCGAENPPDKRFCGDCATALDAPRPRLQPQAEAAHRERSPMRGEDADRRVRVQEMPASQPVDGERKTVTFLFADIKGSMELIEDL